MSPEQARGLPLDGRSDLFAVGVMLFEMLCLRPLFAGNTTEETLARLWFAPIPNPQELRPEIPADLAAVVMSLLARERDERAGTAAEVIAALQACRDCPMDGRDELVALLAQRFVGRAPVRPRGSHPVSRASNSARQRSLPVRTGTVPSEFRPRAARPWLGVAIAGVLIVAVTLGGVVLASRPGTRARPAATSATAPTPADAAEVVATPALPAAAPHPALQGSGGASPPSSEPLVRDKPRQPPGEKPRVAPPRGKILETHY